MEQPLIIVPGAQSIATDCEGARVYVALEMSDWGMEGNSKLDCSYSYW